MKKTTAKVAAKSVSAAKSAGRVTAQAATSVHGAAQGLLATEIATRLNEALASMAKGVPTVYDKAMDAEYLRTAIGGGKHRLFDGGHTLWGAAKASATVETTDGVVGRAMGMVQGLFRDVTTPEGLPLFTWAPETYAKVSTFVSDKFGMSKSAFSDLMTYDAAEVLSGLLGSVALVFKWSDGDAKDFAKIVGASGVATIVQLNPLLACVSIAAMAKSFAEMRKKGEYKEAAGALAEGATSAAVPIATHTAIVTAGGPAAVAILASLLAGMTVTVLAKKAGDTRAMARLSSRVTSLYREPGRSRRPAGAQ